VLQRLKFFELSRGTGVSGGPGGAINLHDGATLSVLRSLFEGCTSGGGGAISATGSGDAGDDGARLSVVATSFISNTDGNGGGAMEFQGLDASAITLQRLIFQDNRDEQQNDAAVRTPVAGTGWVWNI
jgi:hypothetical protein